MYFSHFSLESLLLSAHACFLWGASSATPCIKRVFYAIFSNLHIKYMFFYK
jgi:hypothetical protein